ncbi:hypothetical protein DM860_013685 [Cuscuta australis]|uniref:Uncharacterized protein n=1 Tax=Cuscuta australis TaxID=267555 RepID=A0A328EEH1_9ASTE|nr:hypothetical protein DM860_013685 [Cuscuta australis]
MILGVQPLASTPFLPLQYHRNHSVPPPASSTESWQCKLSSKRLRIRAFATQTYNLSAHESESWEACREALSPFRFSAEEEDEILGKACGLVHSPYWSEEREREVPKPETVMKTLEYLRSLTLSDDNDDDDDDVRKLLKKFPEVLGCSLERELKNNVQALERDWGIKGKPLKKLLRRNPKVLGFNVDCKGDCMAKCTRCWVRF